MVSEAGADGRVDRAAYIGSARVWTCLRKPHGIMRYIPRQHTAPIAARARPPAGKWAAHIFCRAHCTGRPRGPRYQAPSRLGKAENTEHSLTNRAMTPSRRYIMPSSCGLVRCVGVGGAEISRRCSLLCVRPARSISTCQRHYVEAVATGHGGQNHPASSEAASA